MALPQKVVDRLAWEKPKTPGWSGHILILTFTVFVFSILAYLGLQFGFIAYLRSQLESVSQEIEALQSQISEEDQRTLSVFYSRLTNVRTLLDAHMRTSPLFTWIEENTSRSVEVTSFTLNPATKNLTLGMAAVSFDDMIQQMKRFEDSEDLTKVEISSIGRERVSGAAGGSGTSTVAQAAAWTFSASLTFQEAFFLDVPPRAGQ